MSGHFSLVIVAVAFLTTMLVVFLVFSPILLAGLIGSVLAAAIVLILFSHPLWSMMAFILFLPFHSLLMTILLAQLNLPINAVRVAATWKESLLILTMLIVVVRLLIRQRMVVLTWIDGIVLLWLAQIVLYFGLGSLTPTWESSLMARAYGARDWLLYLLPFLIGRLMRVPDDNLHKLLKAILLVGVITSLYGIFEYFLLPVGFHVQLGVPRYFGEMLGLTYPDYLFGLPPNYWAEVAGVSVRRSVSTYLSGQGFAVPFLLIIPVALVWYIKWPAKRNLFLLSVCLFALLLTVTRMTIVVCLIQIMLILFLAHRYKLLVGILLAGVALTCVILILNPAVRTFFVDTILLQDTSSSARPSQWLRGFDAIVEQPLGAGLGYAGQTGARFGGSGAGQEAGYFKITGDLGMPGLVFFLLWFWGILLFSLNLFRTSMGHWKMLGLIVFATAVGFMLNNLTAPPDQSSFLIYVFPFLAGIVVRRYGHQRLAHRSHRHIRMVSGLRQDWDGNVPSRIT